MYLRGDQERQHGRHRTDHEEHKTGDGGFPCRPAQFGWVQPQFLAGQRIQRRGGFGDELLRQRTGLVFGKAFGLIDQGEFFHFLFRGVLEFGLFDAHLLLGQFARRLHGKPFAHRHGAGPSEHSRDARQRHGLRAGRGVRHAAGDAHDQRQCGNQAVVGAQHGGAQGVAADGAMPAFQARQHSAGHAILAAASGDHAQYAGMAFFFARHRLAADFRLIVIAARRGFFAVGERRQDKLRADYFCQSDHNPRPNRDAVGPGILAGFDDFRRPEIRVFFLHAPQPLEDLGD